MPPTARPRYRSRQPRLAAIDATALDARFVDAVRDGSPEALAAFVARPHPGVLEFPLFAPAFTEALLREVHAFEHWCRHHGVRPTRPNTMNAHGVVLAELGLEDAVEGLLADWLAPLAAWAFADHAGATLDHTHAFTVEYAPGGDVELGFHVDDAEVTLNACLGLSFEGAEVYFRGPRCAAHRETPARDDEAWAWAPAPGRAILHAGAHRHGVRPLRAGHRVNLIVWARSSRHRVAHPSPHAGPVDWCPACRAA